MDPTTPLPANEPLEEALSGSSKGAPLVVVLTAVLLFFFILFAVLYYFDALKLGALLPFLPQRQPVPISTPVPTPKPLEINPNYPLLPIGVYNSLVQGASVYYRIVGKVEEVDLRPDGDLEIKLTDQGETLTLTLSSKQTVVTEKGKGFAGFSLSEIKRGDTIELIYTVDLRTGQSLVSQAQVERVE